MITRKGETHEDKEGYGGREDNEGLDKVGKYLNER